MISRTVQIVSVISVVIYLMTILHPGRHAKYYDYVKIEAIFDELIATETNNEKTNLKTCTYEKNILYSREISLKEIYEERNFKTPFNGGEYKPTNCNSLFKTAVIIPYRDREEQLKIFLNYIHWFLQKQNIHYRIIVVEQNDNEPFNRGKLLNVGANEALKLGFQCLILHDVDLLPLNTGNMYACSRKPRHMSSSLDTFRFNLPYLGLFGGAISIRSNQMVEINGLSNLFIGWGGEDDDFFKRLQAHNLMPCRFAPIISTYTMLRHQKEIARYFINSFCTVACNTFYRRRSNSLTTNNNDDRYNKLEDSLKRQKVDGLNSIPNNYKVTLEELYTHIVV